MALKKPKSTPPTHKAERKRFEILKSAAKCFRKTGFHQTSMQEICTETALGPGAVYRYFPSKDAIIEAMAEAERNDARAILAGLDGTENFVDVLALIGKLLGERYKSASDAGMMAEVYAEGLRNKRVGALVRKTENDWLALLTALLQQAQLHGQIDSTLDARHTALLLTAMWDGMIIRHAYHAEERTPALGAFFDDMVSKLLTGAGTVPAKAETKKKAPVKAKLPVKPSVKKEPEKRIKPMVKLPPTTGSLFDDEYFAQDIVEVIVEDIVADIVVADERQMSLI